LRVAAVNPNDFVGAGQKCAFLDEVKHFFVRLR
jgi:hypothetical protein